MAKAANGVNATQPIHQQYQYGGSTGGPLIKDKLFYFVTYDGFQRVQPQNVVSSQSGPAISDPAFGCPQLATLLTAAQNLTLLNECNATKTYLFTHVFGAFQQNFYQSVELIKLDWQVNKANHLSGMTNWHDTKTTADPNLYTGGGPRLWPE